MKRRNGAREPVVETPKPLSVDKPSGKRRAGVSVAKSVRGHGRDPHSCAAQCGCPAWWGNRHWIVLTVAIIVGVVVTVEYMARTLPFVAWMMGRPEPEIDPTPETEGAALWVAASLGNVSAVSAAIAAGGDLEWRHPEHGTTPLMAACVFDRMYSARELVKAGANARARDEQTARWSVLQLAAHNQAMNCVKFLLEETPAGNDINVKDALGCTPVMNAAFRNLPEMIRVLVDHEADLSLRDKNGGLALHWAAYSGATDAMSMLLDETTAVNDIDAKNKKWRRPLHLAVSGTSQGHRDTVKVLLEHGADAHAKDKRGNTPLHDAAAHSDKDGLEALLSYTELRLDIQTPNKFGELPSDRAAQEKNEGTTEVLKTFSALGLAVHKAALEGDVERVKQLAAISAPLSWRDENGKAPLDVAVDDGVREALRAALIARGEA